MEQSRKVIREGSAVDVVKELEAADQVIHDVT